MLTSPEEPQPMLRDTPEFTNMPHAGALAEQTGNIAPVMNIPELYRTMGSYITGRVRVRIQNAVTPFRRRFGNISGQSLTGDVQALDSETSLDAPQITDFKQQDFKARNRAVQAFRSFATKEFPAIQPIPTDVDDANTDLYDGLLVETNNRDCPRIPYAAMIQFYENEEQLIELSEKYKNADPSSLTDEEKSRTIELINDLKQRQSAINIHLIPMPIRSDEDERRQIIQKRAQDRQDLLAYLRDLFPLQNEPALQNLYPSTAGQNDIEMLPVLQRAVVTRPREHLFDRVMRRRWAAPAAVAAMALTTAVLIIKAYDESTSPPASNSSSTTSKEPYTITPPLTPGTTQPQAVPNGEGTPDDASQIEQILSDNLEELPAHVRPWNVLDNNLGALELERGEITPTILEAVESYNTSRPSDSPPIIVHELQNGQFWLSAGNKSDTATILQLLQTEIAQIVTD